MSQSLTLTLPDQLAQQLQAQAEQQNLSLEEIALQRLSVTANYPTDRLSLAQVIASANHLLLTDMFNSIRTAKHAGQSTAEVPATPLTRTIAADMQRCGLIADVQPSDTHPQTRLVLQFPTTAENGHTPIEVNGLSPQTGDPPSLETTFDPSTLPPELAHLLQTLASADPTLQMQVLDALGELYREPTPTAE